MTTPVRDRRFPVRLAAAFALLLGSLTLLGPTAVATPRTPAADGANDPVVTFGLQPTTNKDKPFRANFDLEVTPGQEFSDSVRVRNLSGSQLKLNLYATDALNTENGSVDLLPGADAPKDIGSWITLGKNEVTLASNDFIDVPFSMKVPANATPGDHTAGIVASYIGESPTGSGTSVTIDRRIGTRVLARVAGTLTPKLVVSDLKTSWDGPVIPLGGGTVKISWRVTNAGNVRMGADQAIKVKSPFGFPSKSAHPAKIADLLPGNSVVQEATVSGVLPAFRSSTEVTVKPVAVRAGDSFPSDITSSARTSNWTLPFAFAVLCIFVFVAYKLWKRRQHRLHHQNAAELEALLDARIGGPSGIVR